MVIKCPEGKPRFRFREVMEGRQRLAFCGNRVVEVKTFKKGKTKIKKLRRRK